MSPVRIATTVALVAAATGADALTPKPRPPGPPARAEGTICGDPGLVGAPLAPVTGPGGCGIAHPVRVTRAAGVALDPPPVIACPTAVALKVWLQSEAKPAFAPAGPPLEGLDIAAGYVCRNVNSDADGALSEHARGRAVDIMRFRLGDGSVVRVETAWRARARGPILRRIHAAACGIFGTTLGPDSDRHHSDHFHFDVADRRRPYCP